jgi:hypothetical protein
VSGSAETAIYATMPQTIGAVTYGLHGVSRSSENGSAGVVGEATDGFGATRGVIGAVSSPSGIAGLFESEDGLGTILSGRNSSGEVFSVTAGGTVTGTSFTGDGSGLTGISDVACSGCISEGELAFDPATQSELDGQTHVGEDITGGTVAEAWIDGALARDSEVMTIVESHDGAGSGMDADTVDGAHATAFASAGHDHLGETWTTATDGLTVETSGTGTYNALKGVATDTGDGYAVGVMGKISNTNGSGVLGWSTDTQYGGIALKGYNRSQSHPTALLVNDNGGPMIMASQSHSLTDTVFEVGWHGDVNADGHLRVDGLIFGAGGEAPVITSDCGKFVAVTFCPAGAVDAPDCGTTPPAGTFCEYDGGCSNLSIALNNCGDYDWYFKVE